MKENIPATLITDNMAGFLMNQGRVRAVFVGADRIAANGDAANKIGTYSLAVLARENRVPFYIAAPFSTIDLGLRSGKDIPIEMRPGEEVTGLGKSRTAPPGVDTFNPAFDVTSNRYITAIITDRGVAKRPFSRSLKLLSDK
jgi:methylthioribose-1-phosphate isomerase